MLQNQFVAHQTDYPVPDLSSITKVKNKNIAFDPEWVMSGIVIKPHLFTFNGKVSRRIGRTGRPGTLQLCRLIFLRSKNRGEDQENENNNFCH